MNNYHTALDQLAHNIEVDGVAVRAPKGAMIIQAMNTGILISGFSPEFNLVVKSAVIIVILVLQSPLSARLFRRLPGAQK